jgi:hypothetical protein
METRLTLEKRKWKRFTVKLSNRTDNILTSFCLFISFLGCILPKPAPECPKRELPNVNEFEPVKGFQLHPNARSGVVAPFSEHFKSGNVKEFVNFTKKLAPFRGVSKEDISCAFTRYKCFLYLHKQYPDTMLVPTLDIEIVWRSHCIRPSIYRRDCEKNFGKILPHRAKPTIAMFEIRQEALILTMDLWKKHFGSDYLYIDPQSLETVLVFLINSGEWYHDEPMWFEPPPQVDDEKMGVCISLSEEDVMNDLSLYFQMEIELANNVLFRGLKLWNCSLKSYERYLFMLLKIPEEKLADPSMFIDLAWFAHMMDPEAYISDITRIVGEVLDHKKLPMSNLQGFSLVWEEEFAVKYEEEHQFVRHLRGETVYQERELYTIQRQKPLAQIIDRQIQPQRNL